MLPQANTSYAELRMVPLFHAAWLFAAGIVLAHTCWLRPSWLLMALLPIAALCVVATWKARRVVWLPVAVIFLLLGCWCAEMEPRPGVSTGIAAMSDGLLRTVEGTVVNAGGVRSEVEESVDEPWARERNPVQRVDLDVARMERVTDAEDRLVPVEGRVRLNLRWLEGAAVQTLRCGERVRALVRLRPAVVYRDPGVWNYADYLVDQGISATGTVSVEQVDAASGRSLACWMNAWQHEASARMLALPTAMRGFPTWMRFSQEDAAMLAAMVAGDRTYLTHKMRTGFERTGSFHMLVVSGFHLAIVAGAIFWVTRRVRLGRVPTTLITLAASFAYALFTGFAVPVQRSLWMVTLYLLGRLFFRRRSPLNVLGFAALCLLVASPRSLWDAGFQMTLLAVMAIAGVAASLLEKHLRPLLRAMRDLRLVALDAKMPVWLARWRMAMRMIAEELQLVAPKFAAKFTAWRAFPWCVQGMLRAAEALVVSAVVELAMTLPMAMYFHRITLFALPVNMLILPLLAVLMPVALLTLLVSVVWPAAAKIPAAAVALLLHGGVEMVRFFGSLHFGDLRMASPTAGQLMAFCLLLILSIGMALWATMSRRRFVFSAACVALMGAAVVVVVPRGVDHPQNAMLFEAVDVGQGDSLLLISPEGKTLLVDGGGFGGGPRQAAQDFDIGEEVVSQALWARGIRHLDAVALSHAHSDHMGGLPAILRNFHPAELWVGGNPHTTEYDALLDEAAGLGVSVRQLQAGDAIALGGVRVNVLAPAEGYRPGAEPSNNDSLVLRAAWGETSVLLEGDAEASEEEALLRGPNLESTLLKVAHHGSASSTQTEFLAKVAPQWAVISCGKRNRYGHPREEVLAELQKAHIQTLRTDLTGAACLVLDGKSVHAVPGCLE